MGQHQDQRKRFSQTQWGAGSFQPQPFSLQETCYTQGQRTRLQTSATEATHYFSTHGFSLAALLGFAAFAAPPSEVAPDINASMVQDFFYSVLSIVKARARQSLRPPGGQGCQHTPMVPLFSTANKVSGSRPYAHCGLCRFRTLVQVPEERTGFANKQTLLLYSWPTCSTFVANGCG